MKLSSAARAVMATVEAGDFFGELALLTAHDINHTSVARAATVRAYGEVQCFRLGRGPFQQLVGSSGHMRQLLEEQRK